MSTNESGTLSYWDGGMEMSSSGFRNLERGIRSATGARSTPKNFAMPTSGNECVVPQPCEQELMLYPTVKLFQSL